MNSPRILVVSAGLPSKRNGVVKALRDQYCADFLPGMAHPEKFLDKFWRKFGVSNIIGRHARNIKDLNHSIIERAGSFDILFIIKGNFVTAATLQELQSLINPPKIVGWSPDDIYLSHNNSAILYSAAPFYDIFFTAKSLNIKNSELTSMGFVNSQFIHQGFDRDYHYPIPDDKSRFFGLATFVGSAEQDRFEKLNYLAKHGLEIHVYGNGWTSAMSARADKRLVINNYPLLGHDYIDALTNSAISFCFLRKLNRDTHTSRTFEIPACGGFMIAERSDEHLKFFSEDKEAVYFDDAAELLTKVKYYLSHPKERKTIAMAGRHRCLNSDYSYHRLTKKMIDFSLLSLNR